MLTAILVLILTTGLLIPGCSSPSKPGDSAGPEPLNEESPTAPVGGTQVGNLAPDFQLQNLDGQTVSLGSLWGKPVLINFWATWCGPCRSEMPYIQEIYEEWTNKGLVVLAINIGESSSKVEEFMQGYNLSFTVLLDTKQDVAQRYNITGIPTTFFLDKDGIIQDKVIGAFQNKAQIENRLSKIIP
jgi:thiol-disulfide isomerase/thioredoxin